MWVLLSLGAAILVGTTDALSKKALQSHRHQTVAWVRLGWAGFFLLPMLFFSEYPADPQVYWMTIGLAIPFEIVAALLYQRALQISPLSLTIPYLAFTPLFLLFMAWGLLGETPSLLGFLGVLLIALGGGALQRNNILKGGFHFEQGSYLMLVVAFLYSVTASLAKKALLVSSPFFFSATYFPLIALFMLPWVVRSSHPKELFFHPRLFASLGFFEALACLLQFVAMLQGNVAYIISIKRLSVLLALFYGKVIFHEEQIFRRFVGAFFMILGAALIAFG